MFNSRSTLNMYKNWLFNVTINDISVKYVTAHRCAGGLKKKLDLRSGSQRHRYFVRFYNVPVQAPTRGNHEKNAGFVFKNLTSHSNIIFTYSIE